jgi:hypothetical protein
LQLLNKAIEELIAQKWPRGKPDGLRLCVESGNNKTYDGYKDRVVIRSSNKNAPTVVDQGKNVLEKKGEVEPKIPYAGSYVVGLITLWAQDNNFGKRINANLLGVQFVRDGVPFGPASADPETDFEVVPDAPAATGAAAIDAGEVDWMK